MNLRRAPSQVMWQTYLDDGIEAYEAARYAEAEKLFKLAVAEGEQFGASDSRLADSLNNLALMYHTQGDYAKAKPLYKRSLAIWERALGPEHPNLADSLEDYGVLLKATGRAAEAQTLLDRAAAIRKGKGK